MARAIWTGSVSFGLVNVPVGLFSATEDHTVHFSQFEKGTPNRIRYKRVNEETGEEVDFSHIVKGYDIGGGEYVIVDPDELDEVAPGRSRTIDITDFVEQAEIDPIFYQKTYYLAPQGEGAERAYGLLLEAMKKAGRVGIANFVMRGKQYLAAIRPDGPVLALETMFFADEIRDPSKELDELPTAQDFTKRELDIAASLIDSMTVGWDPAKYRDTYRDRVMDLIDAKRRGEEVVTEGEPDDSGQVVDLMEALQRSLDSARGRRAPADLSSLSKDELYQMAQELGVPGRSKMAHKALEKAVAEAQRQEGTGSRGKAAS